MKKNGFRTAVIVFLFIIVLGRIIFADVNIDPPNVERDFSDDVVILHNSGGNAYFTTNESLPFSLIQLDPQYVRFNDTEFRVESDDRTNITVAYLCDNVSTEEGGNFVLHFYTTSESNRVYYNISRAFDDAYLLYLNNVFEEGLYSVDDNISFTIDNPLDVYQSLKKAQDYDIVVDGYIDFNDLEEMWNYYSFSETVRADINEDGKINYLDRSVLQNRLGEEYV